MGKYDIYKIAPPRPPHIWGEKFPRAERPKEDVVEVIVEDEGNCSFRKASNGKRMWVAHTCGLTFYFDRNSTFRNGNSCCRTAESDGVYPGAETAFYSWLEAYFATDPVGKMDATIELLLFVEHIQGKYAHQIALLDAHLENPPTPWNETPEDRSWHPRPQESPRGGAWISKRDQGDFYNSKFHNNVCRKDHEEIHRRIRQAKEYQS